MTKNKKFAIFLFSCLFSLFLSSNCALALEINYPQVPGAVPPQEFLKTASSEQILSLYFLYIYNLAIWLSGIIAFGAFLYGCFLYFFSFGKPERIASAKNQITYTFLGLLVLLSSFLIMKTINTELVILEMPKFEPIEQIERPEIASVPPESYLSLISTEVPFAAIIGIIFEEERMERIKENAETTLDIVEDIEEQSEDLKEKVDQCSCDQADPQCDPCVSGQSCTCDTCENVRDDIEDLEIDNLEKLDELEEELNKTTQEIRLLLEELIKLERAEKFMLECELRTLDSLAAFLNTKKNYLTNKWLILEIKFWENILTIEDWANFYCPVSGTVSGEYRSISETSIGQEIAYTEHPEEGMETMACTVEIPVGEIIDRAKRIGYKLTERLEALSQKNREMAEAVDKMHVLVSECTSQLPRCISICIQVKSVCVIELCVGSPCPFSEIAEQLEKIKEIKSQIEEIVDETINIIDKVVPKLLEDLENELRGPMKVCVTELLTEFEWEQEMILLADCESALHSDGPKGVIRYCCFQEPEYNECLNKCYLEEGQKKYKECLEDCLKEKSKELKRSGKTKESEIIANCLHQNNFYCCGG